MQYGKILGLAVTCGALAAAAGYAWGPPEGRRAYDKLIEDAQNESTLEDAVLRLRSQIRELAGTESIGFRHRYPIWKGIETLLASYRTTPDHSRHLGSLIEDLIRYQIARDHSIYGRDFYWFVRCQVAAGFSDRIREYGHAVNWRLDGPRMPIAGDIEPPAARVLRYLRQNRVPAKGLLRAFELLAIAGAGSPSRRVDVSIGPEVDPLLEALPEGIQAEALRRVVYDLSWFVEGRAGDVAVAPEVTLKWITRLYRRLKTDQARALSIELLGRLGGAVDPHRPKAHGEVWDPSLDRRVPVKTAQWRVQPLPEGFLLSLCKALPPAEIPPVFAAVGHRLDLGEDPEAAARELLAAAKSRGTDEGAIEGLLETLLRPLRETLAPGAGYREDPERRGAENLGAVRRFAEIRLGKPVTNRQEDGEFGVFRRHRKVAAFGDGCWLVHDLKYFRDRAWTPVAVIRSACGKTPRDDLEIRFRLGWKFRGLLRRTSRRGPETAPRP